MNRMREIKCIIFDCDGVLVDSETISNQVMLDMGRELGLDMTLDQAKSEFNGRSFMACLELIALYTQKTIPDYFEREFRRRTFALFNSDMKPVRGVTEFIETLTLPYCVASSGPVDKIRLNLTITGLLPKFENRIFSSYQINSWKPDPGIFLFAAKEMGFSPADCVVIEDSKTGVTAAVRGGFKVFGFAEENNPKELEEAGAVVFNDFRELPDLFNKIVSA